MLRQLMYKWFGLELPPPCETCEVLRAQLTHSEQERRDLLVRLLDRAEPPSSPSIIKEEYQPIKPQFTPWRVRQQMLEAEDRKQAQLMREKQKEMTSTPITASVNELEKELGVGQ